jgi:hypothetical protein
VQLGLSGQLMVEAPMEGKAGPEQIAQLAQRSAKNKIPQLWEALEAQRARMRAVRQQRNSLSTWVARLTPRPFCASSLKGHWMQAVQRKIVGFSLDHMAFLEEQITVVRHVRGL